MALLLTWELASLPIGILTGRALHRLAEMAERDGERME